MKVTVLALKITPSSRIIKLVSAFLKKFLWNTYLRIIRKNNCGSGVKLLSYVLQTLILEQESIVYKQHFFKNLKWGSCLIATLGAGVAANGLLGACPGEVGAGGTVLLS